MEKAMGMAEVLMFVCISHHHQQQQQMNNNLPLSVVPQNSVLLPTMTVEIT